MKKIFSFVLCLLVASGCAQAIIGRSENAVRDYNRVWTTDRKAGFDFWTKQVYKDTELEAIVNSHLRKLGKNAGEARFEILGSKLYKTWVFSGTIFKDVVEVDALVKVPPPAPEKGDLIQETPKTFRQLSYLAEFDGRLQIIQSEIREDK